MKLFLLASLSSSLALAAPQPPAQVQREDLTAVQREIQRLEGSLNSSKQTAASLTSELQRLEKLLKLQALEIQLGTIELEKMEERLLEMESRYQSLSDGIVERKKRLREYLSVLPSLEHSSPIVRLTDKNMARMTQYREFVARLLTKDRSEILTLKEHLAEVDTLRSTLAQEREQVIVHTEDLKEKQAILALNKNLKNDLLKKTHAEQSQNLRVYEAAKAAESELETMLTRIRDEKMPPASQVLLSPSASGSGFAGRKGKLSMPFQGEILSAFGKKYDSASSLYTFHKGIDIRTPAGAPVRAVFGGKVVFSGTLGGYGKLLIIDHGDQFYSLAGQLGEILKRAGEEVKEGELIAQSASDETPLYFEIRQRHVAVNPVPWLKQSLAANIR